LCVLSSFFFFLTLLLTSSTGGDHVCGTSSAAPSVILCRFGGRASASRKLRRAMPPFGVALRRPPLCNYYMIRAIFKSLASSVNTICDEAKLTHPHAHKPNINR
jgi:hypothetical protein